MHVDFKITTWERVFIPESDREKVLELLKSKTVESAEDLFNELDADDLIREEVEEVSIQMTVEENDGNSTIEMYEETGSPILWQNGLE
jgi:hypothetical protein